LAGDYSIKAGNNGDYGGVIYMRQVLDPQQR